MSKSFTLDQFYQKEVPRSLRKIEWDVFSSKDDSNYFTIHLKEIEDRLLKNAKERAIHIEKEAYEKGFSQGERDGLEFGRRRAEIFLQQFKNLLEELDKTIKIFYKQCEDDLIYLMFTILRKILHNELFLNENVVIETLKETLKLVVDRQKIIVHLNPVDFQYLTSPTVGIHFLKDDFEGVKLLEDPNITRGGCVIETSFGDIDATIESQLKKVETFLFESMKKGHEE